VLNWKKDDADTPHLIGVDLDHCRDRQTGTIEPWAQAIINKSSTYTEISPSGAGIRMFLFGVLPPRGRKKGPYENYETGRYVTVTGHHLNGTPRTIEHRQKQLLNVHKAHFCEAEKHEPNGRPNGKPHDLDTRELLERAFRSKNGARIKALFNGDTTDYRSPSEADLAFCNYLAFWFTRDEERIFEVVCISGLYRTKWKREDYRRRTIAKAVAGCQQTYEPPLGGKGPRRGSPKKNRAIQVQTARAGIRRPQIATPAPNWTRPPKTSQASPPRPFNTWSPPTTHRASFGTEALPGWSVTTIMPWLSSR
jgi:primase-polymerase (primpol)-like protein